MEGAGPSRESRGEAGPPPPAAPRGISLSGSLLPHATGRRRMRWVVERSHIPLPLAGISLALYDESCQRPVQLKGCRSAHLSPHLDSACSVSHLSLRPSLCPSLTHLTPGRFYFGTTYITRIHPFNILKRAVRWC